MTTFLHPANNISSTLDGNITDVATTLDVASGEGASFPTTYPYHVVIDDLEVVRVTDVTTDTLTIVRAQEGTSATAHLDGDSVKLNVTAQYVSELQDQIDVMQLVMVAMAGGADGIIPADGLDNLVVAQQTVADMTVKIGTGAASVNGSVAYNSASADTDTIVAPVASTRVDVVQIDDDGNIEVVSGTEGAGSPGADADALSLAELTITVGMTEIETGDISDTRTYV